MTAELNKLLNCRNVYKGVNKLCNKQTACKGRRFIFVLNEKNRT
jgi:hypothetical protein